MRGFTLIEIIVAIFLITIGTLGAFALIQRTTAFASISSSRFVAAYLAQEGIEVVRNIRDTNWLEGVPWDEGLFGCGAGCEADYNDSVLSSYLGRFLKIGSGFYTYDSGTETKYKRKIIVTPQVDALEVSVEVLWGERGRSHQVVAQENLYNWR